MKIKEIDRTANVAWSPDNVTPIFLAAGTAAQQLDASFSTSAAIEVYSLNLAETAMDMELRGSAPSEHRFHKIVWGASEKDYGIIVGGCDGGRLQFYSANKLLSGEDGMIDSRERHTGPVRALDFNRFQKNLLATGASESELLVWDLNNLEIPMKPGPKSQPFDEITWVSWNKQVQHILASVFPQRCIMWDLRKNEPIIKITDRATRTQWKIAAWHPEVATQLCIASEDDQYPIIQLWDLRFATSPLKVLQRHQRGILSIAWCQLDSETLASCGKENHILFWNPTSNVEGGEIICDITTADQWNFDVSWCPRNPALISTSSFDGHVSIHTLTGGRKRIETSTKIADSFPGMENFVQAPTPSQQPAIINLHKAPKWKKRPVGASFAFGKLVTFKKTCPGSAVPGVTAPATRSVEISVVVSDLEAIERANKLQNVLQYGQFSEFCLDKASLSRTPHEQRVWNFMKANFEEKPREESLKLLGFDSQDVMSKIMKVIDKPANAKASDEFDDLAKKMQGLGEKSHGSSSSVEKFKISTDDALRKQQNNHQRGQPSTASKMESTKPMDVGYRWDADGLISQALLFGHTESAVELCLQNGRMADAIILAASCGPTLLAETQARYLKQNPSYLSSLIGAVVTNDWTHVIEYCDVESWKEVMAAILTQVKNPEELCSLCEVLGLRLETEGKDSAKLNAQLCYICAGDLNKLVENWIDSSAKPYPLVKMQDLVDLVMLLKKAVERQGRTVELSGSVASFLSEYAFKLIAEGNLYTALTYLEDSVEPETVNLRERLYRALNLKSAYQVTLKPEPQTQGRIPSSRRESATFYPGQRSRLQSYNEPQTAPASFQQPFANSTVTQQPYPVPQQPYSMPVQRPYPVPAQQPYPAPAQQPYPVPAQQPYSVPKPVPPPSTMTEAPPSTTNLGNQHLLTSKGRHVLDTSTQVTLNRSAASTFVPQEPSQHPFTATASIPQAQVAAFPQQDAYSSGASIPGAMNSSLPQADKPCWNDPPALLRSTRSQPKTEYTPRAPITHPLYGTVPQENVPGMPGMPMQMPASGGYESNTFNPYGQPPQVLQASVPQVQAPSPSLVATPQQQQQPLGTARVAEPPKPKGPVPEEHMYLQTVFNELRERCNAVATNPQARRKLEDVGRKLEVLYDALRENALSAPTLQGLHQMVKMVQYGDYAGAINLHTQLVSGPDFSKIASFMPGLKVLLQLALQLQVFLQ